MNEKLMFEISERMGKEVHDAWMEKRKKEKGWHSPDKCPNYHPNKEAFGYDPKFKKNLWCKDCHPCMCSYAELPESEKELDRQYPKLFFDILKSMGYVVIKPGDGKS